MRKRLAWVLVLVVGFAGCNRRGTGRAEWQALTPAQTAPVESGVRTFMAAVAHDVTQEGPLAWSRFFDDNPAFFMAVEWTNGIPKWRGGKRGDSECGSDHQTD